MRLASAGECVESLVLTVGSLFSGIGGLDLGLERAGMEVKWQCELDPYCSKVLAKHWPAIPNLGDVTAVDWSEVERVDLVCGGFPCQPFSLAGPRKGQNDKRYLWPEVVRAVRVLRPTHLLLENVPGILASPEFGVVLSDLAACGYDAEWDCIPAAAVGAPHLRYRVFVVAYRRGARRWEDPRSSLGDEGADAGWSPQDDHVVDGDGQGSRARDVADTDSERELQPGRTFQEVGGRPGNSSGWLPEPDVGRVAHGVPSRVDRLRALGNAVVPQVAEFVGRQLLAELERRAA